MNRNSLYASGWAVPALLVLSSLAVTFAFYEANWAPGLGMLPWLCMLSVLLTVVSLRVNVTNWVLHSGMLGIGVILVASASARYYMPSLSLAEGVRQVIHRLQDWTVVAWWGQETTDSLPFTFLLSLCFWIAYHYSTWLVYRAGKVWWAVTAPAVALMVNIYYAPQISLSYLVIYMFCALLLVVRVSLQGLTREWQLAKIPHDHTFSEEFIFDAVYIVGALVLVAWLLPPLTLEQQAAALWVKFEQPSKALQRRWEALFPTMMNAAPVQEATIYGDSLILGGAVSLSREPLYSVKMAKSTRMQAAVYDLYDGHQWWASGAKLALMSPSEYPALELFGEREWVQQEITALASARSLIAAPSPRAFSVDVKSEQIAIPVNEKSQVFDLYSATARHTIEKGETYIAVSAISQASEDMLREAGNTYPSWLSGIYLEIPSSVPERVKELAKEVTAGVETDYDRALAIESYLRKYQYSTQIQAPPSGMDAIDYFLFNSKVGYCNYFAGSMVIMARSVGIPARVAAGYAAGQYDPDSDAYIFLVANAHSWAQLYFPGYGWIDFEPTPAQERIVRPVSEQLPGNDTQPTVEPRGIDDMYGMEPELLRPEGSGDAILIPKRFELPPYTVGVLVTVFLLFTAYMVFWVWPRRGWTPAERYYANLVIVASGMGVRASGRDTPGEYGMKVAAKLPEAKEAVMLISNGFSFVRYSGKPTEENPYNSSDLNTAWRQVWKEVMAHLRTILFTEKEKGDFDNHS